MQTSERERIARDSYDQLSPGARRERFVLSPVYRSAYNRAIDSEDRMTLPRYFWRKWLAVLGAEAAALYVVLRDISRVEAAGTDSWCWPEQSELGRRIGVSKNTLRKALDVLEHHGFIRSQRQRKPRPGGWQEVQGTNNYEVYLDIPLIPEDAVELLLSEMTDYARASEFKFCTQSAMPVENPLSSNSALRASEFNSCTQSGEGSRALSPSEVKSCALNVKNVDNVDNVRSVAFKEDPRVKALTAAERREREELAQEVGESLCRMSGMRDDGPHRSLGLHRRFAFLMPATMVKQALMATRDAVDEQRAGRKTLRNGPSGYFAGIVFSLADQAGIELGVNRKGGARRVPPPQRNQGTKDPCIHGSKQGANKAAVEAPPSEAERAKVHQMLQTLIKTWDVDAPPPIDSPQASRNS